MTGKLKPPGNTSNPDPRGRGATGALGPSAVPKGSTPKVSPDVKKSPGAEAPRAFEPPADWDAFLKGFADVSEPQILMDIGALRGRKDFVAIEKALTAYLRYHGQKHAAPWMYEQLATAMEINKRDPAAIKTAIGWGAYLAQQGKDPVALIAASDQLLLHKYYEIALTRKFEGDTRVRLADVLDQAMEAASSRAEPILMSLVLAENLKDPERMGDSAETMLSLGWPGGDPIWRTEVPRRVRDLAKTLRLEGRGPEAKALLDRLPAIEARDLVVQLTWTGDAALDLIVDEPLGASCDHFTPRTVFGGALIKEGRGKDKEAIYSCPRGFDGDYTIRVGILYNDEKTPAQTAKLEIVTHEGTDDEEVTARTLSLSKLAPTTITLKGGRRKTVLPYQALNQINAPENSDASDVKGKPLKLPSGTTRPKP